MYFNYLLMSINFVFYLALAAILAFKYSRTRDVGFIWLGVAVIIWPLASSLFEDDLIRHFVTFLGEPVTIGSFVTSLNLVRNLIGVALLLVAALYLCKAKSDDKRSTIV